jgi:hypothetical protein
LRIHDLPGGGPAFPSKFNPRDEDLSIVLFAGVLVRDYLIAHAPPTPQPWFKPALMVEARPYPPADMSEQEKQDLILWENEGLDAETASTPRMREHLKAAAEYNAGKWKRDQFYERELALRWPAAWADEQLRLRAEWLLTNKPEGA